MEFYNEIVEITNKANSKYKTIKKIEDNIRNEALKGEYYANRVYELEGKCNKHISQLRLSSSFTTDFLVNDYEIDFSKSDNLIIAPFIKMGFAVSYTLVNKNPNPEFGEEGLKLGVYLNISWKQ